jgi:hypothetical protein
LRTTWFKKISLWSRGIVDLAEKAKCMDTDPTNQLIEAVFKNVKHCQDVFEHVRDPGQYILHRWDDCRKSEKRFIDEFQYLRESLNKILVRRSDKKKRKMLSQDVAIQETEEKTDEPWSRKGSPVEAETKLRNSLLFISMELFGLINNSKCHGLVVKTHVENKNDMMSYPTFNKFMRAQGSGRLKPGHMKTLQAFETRQTALQMASASATDGDHVDDNNKERDNPV